MAKKKTLEQSQRRRTSRSRRKKAFVVGVIGLITVLSVSSLGNPWRVLPGSGKLGRWFNPPAAPNPTPPPSLSKEYIYAGGRLIATETAGASLAPPMNLVATTLSNLQPSQVSITWQATTGADHYQLEKTNNINTQYTPVNSNVTSTTFTDNSVSSVTAYLYRVRAVDQFGNASAYSSIDLATAITFTDDTLYSQSTLVKAAHINELRQSVDAVRALASLPAVNWGGSVVPNVTEVQATHIQDLRVNLDAARSALNLPQCSYTDNSLAALRASNINKEHIEQIRECVK
jgi:hypothetical protein